MSEGPEVRCTTDWLMQNLCHHIVRDVKVAGRFLKQPIQDVDTLKNKRVLGVRCKGKVIVIDFESSVSAISTLGMSGLWTRHDASHTAITLWCELPPTRGILPVHYVDQRRFGNFVVTETRKATSKLDDLGWDALSEPMAYGKVFTRAKKYLKRDTPIAQVMLDQDVFAGVGNYIRAEAMYRAKVNPWTPYKDMVYTQVDTLCQKVVDVMYESYKRRGATLENFYDGDGNRGDHVDFLEVYGKTNDPHGNPVERKKDKNGRTVWWVPGVQ